MGTNGPAWLSGAVVQRADVTPEAAVLRVRVPGATWMVMVAAGWGVGVAEAGGKGAGGGAGAGARARAGAGTGGRRLLGGRIVGIGEEGVLVDVRGELRVVGLEGGKRGRVVIREGGEDVGATAEEVLRARGEKLLAALGAQAVLGGRKELVVALERARRRVARRVDAVAADLARIADADAIVAQAQWLVAAAARAKRGAKVLEVTDWSTGEPRPLALAIDPARPAREQVEALFKRARRLRKGATVARARLAEAEATKAALERLLEEARAAEDTAALDAIAARARETAHRDFSLAPAVVPGGPGGASAKPGERLPYRTFRAASGARVLVGRGAADNDVLTLRVARPHDVWLHARGTKGAHVVVPLDKGHTCPPEVLIDAAHLAAHFSDARGEASVEVTYAPRRYVRKPRGSAVGMVVVEREKILGLRVEEGRIERLLGSEEG